MSEELTKILADLVGAKFDGLAKDIERLNEQYSELSRRFGESSGNAEASEVRSDVDKLSVAVSEKAETAFVASLHEKLEGVFSSVQQKAEASAVERLERRVGDLDERLQVVDKAVDVKLEVLSDTAKKIQLLHDTIMETAVNSRHSVELERLRVQLQTLGSVAEPKVQFGRAVAPKKGLWHRLCGCERRRPPTSPTARRYSDTLPVAVDKSPSLVPGFPEADADEPPPGDEGLQMEPQDVLSAVLAIEKSCLTPGAAMVESAADLVIDRLVDEPGMTYCTCSSPESQTIVSCLWAIYDDVSLDAAKRALLCEEERAIWDADSEFQICRRADKDDAACSELVHHVLHAPWPFWDREVLQRRCQLPLGSDSGEEGVAIVMRSVADDILPEHPSRVRAFVSKAAFLLRPENAGRGLQLTVCSQIDIGGLVPQWAQSFLTRLAAQRAEAWKDKLREHCLTMATRAG